MPNYVTHRVRVTGPEEQIAALMDKVILKEEDIRSGQKYKVFDFNTLIPMPQRLRDMVKGSETGVGLALLGYEVQTLEKMAQGDFDPSPVKVGVKKTMVSYLRMPWVIEKKINSVDDMVAYLKKENPNAVKLGQQALDNYRDYGYTDWYDWAVDKWGTKWNSSSYSETSRRDGYWEFTFNTAWSYVEPIFKCLSEEFPELEFDVAYIDEGWGFAGTEVWVGGTSVSQAMREYDKEDESYMRQMHEEVFGEPPEDEEEEYDDPWANESTDRFALILGPGERLPN